jgi:hypothetical protein
MPSEIDAIKAMFATHKEARRLALLDAIEQISQAAADWRENSNGMEQSGALIALSEAKQRIQGLIDAE